MESGTSGSDAGGSPARRRAATEAIDEARAGSARLIESLTRLWDDVVEASALVANDDEHDPEGATVAFERAQLRDVLKQAHADLDALERAAERIRTGDYWICEHCGGPIAPERLVARPTARTCIGCAADAAAGGAAR
ncbi:TraR/DksA family transcriptional regulator [Streptomyces liangshanensis]|uniref:Dksa/trar family transcriptional regulator n=1 Tax=Streptomyces liangshanensis TaxID=2717324 RepID=A0A6G9GRU0_9ACTN|nr:TraR/DksA C4-type zinc finger protein [Streptomyces liangshanensis]QIQ00935.1 dksa/trar family transcriptional regulator [Streptomyces liangshanensis]